MTIARILEPTDFSSHAERASDYALSLARTCGASVHLLYGGTTRSLTTSGRPRRIQQRADVHARLVRETEERLRRAVTPHSTGVTCQVGRGQPSRQIIDVARERGIDVIVMGTHGRTGLAHLVMGSVASEWSGSRHVRC